MWRNFAPIEKANTENKRPEADLRPHIELGPLNSIRRSGLGSRLLDRLVSATRQTGIHLTEFRELGNMGFVNHPALRSIEHDRDT